MKELDIHDDYTLWLLMKQLGSQLNIICAYMQNTTPYGDAYERCFKTIQDLQKPLDQLENDLQECVEARAK